MDVVGRWDELMAADPGETRVAEAAALVDSARTGNDPELLLARLDRLGQGCPGSDLGSVLGYAFADLGFRGDPVRYHHERNSLLSHVLDARRGLPILLAVVVADIARAAGVDLALIGMPGHFLLGGRAGTATDAANDVYVDAFAGGTLLDPGACEELFRRINGPSPEFDAGMLQPVGLQEVAARILANLKGTYAAAGDLTNLRWVTDLRRRVPGVGPAEALDHAAVLDQLGRYDDAAEVLEGVAARTTGRTAAAAAHRARALRARAN